MSFIPHIPYREARHGVWGEPTSTINWCEEDYNISFYCAETVNTLTNLVFLWLGVKGIRNVWAYSHPPVLLLAFCGYLVVGLGSMAFHTSLKYSMQLADELPMIYTVCIMGFASFSHKKSRWVSFLIAAILVGLAGFITVFYLRGKDPLFHQVAYGILTLSSVFKGFFDMICVLRPALKRRNPDEADAIIDQMWKLAWTGIIQFLGGFLIWNLDNIFCRQLVKARSHILLPWAIVLEGHGWWHILTGLGGTNKPYPSEDFQTTALFLAFHAVPCHNIRSIPYHMITWTLWQTRCLDGDERDFELQWAPYMAVPQVVPRWVPRSREQPVKGVKRD